jgi:hypothetical protein
MWWSPVNAKVRWVVVYRDIRSLLSFRRLNRMRRRMRALNRGGRATPGFAAP